jgi:translation initiation factor IF-2
MMNVPVTQVIQTCFNLGLFVSINQRLDAEIINIVADEFGFKTEFVSADVVSAIQEEEDKEEDLLPRPPIVTVMGHVDHGKTSLLDYIRKANVIAGEAGGITQHIGAYNVKLEDGRRITFLDTPGHEAFTAMRARGAKVTDIAIIIVAADDGIMPQTVEAINHASAAGVPIVFAINKVDKPSANPDKIKETLASMNYLVEEWGGKYQSQDISAKQGTGVKELLEKVLLEAELLDLKANPNRKATGSVIESTLDKGRGYVATVLVSNGTLRMGDVMLAGTSYGRIKAMFNERNQRIEQAGPSEPVMILGLNGAPQAGDNFNVFDHDHEARDIATRREQLAREQGLRTSKHLTLEELGRRRALGDFHELNVIVKGDVDGSIEALSDALIKLSTEEIEVNVIHKAVGQISESDIMLAAASNAIIIGFQVRPSADARRVAEREEVEIRLYSIIYDAIEELKDAMEGLLSPDIKEEITATLEIRETFHISKVGTIAGCIVKEGKIKRTNKVRLIRDGIVVYTGQLASLKRMKDDVKEVGTGFECGLNIANYNDIKVGDIIEGYEEIEVKKNL